MAFDLDDDKLKATRKAKGLDNGPYEEISDKNVVGEKIMSKEAFNELINNFKVVEHLTLYGRKAIKYHVKKMQQQIDEKDKLIKELEEKYLHEKLAKEEVEELLECSVPKLRIKNMKEKIKLDSTIVGGRRNCKTLEYGIKLGKIKACEELLEENK